MKDEQEKKAEQTTEYSFIREKIKERPKSKKQIAMEIGGFLGLAVVFGLIASVVMAVLTPKLQEWMYPGEDAEVITIPKDETASGEEEAEVIEATATPVPTQEPIVNVVEKELELQDYTGLYNEMYNVADGIKNSLVTVVGVSSNVDWLNNPYENEGQASGIVVADNGKEFLILTDKKVIEGVEEINILFATGEQLPAVQKKYDGNTDLAILAVEKSAFDQKNIDKIKVITLGNSKLLHLGTPILAVGSPLGTTESMLNGSITSLKTVSDTEDVSYPLIRTDMLGSASANGVLINFAGEVVGIYTRDLSAASENGTITAYAISELKGIIERLSNNLGIAYLGVRSREVTEDDEATYGMPRGVGITKVSMDSPAMAAGIQSGDIIVEIEGKKITSQREFESAINGCEPEQLISITAMRLGAEGYVEIKFDVTLSVMP
jgi:serine protease Do